MNIPEYSKKVLLTKYQASKLVEGMCPICNKDLDSLGPDFYECPHCGNYFGFEWEEENLN